MHRAKSHRAKWHSAVAPVESGAEGGHRRRPGGVCSAAPAKGRRPLRPAACPASGTAFTGSGWRSTAPSKELFAAALQRWPDYWAGDLAQLRADMALEANGSDHIKTACNLVRAQRHLVTQYLRGELAQEDVRDVDMEAGGDREVEEPEDCMALSAAQRALERCVNVNVKRSMEAREAGDDDLVDLLQLEAFEKNRILAALGPPGTGKTLVVNRCVRRWQARGARILFALPTGQLADAPQPP